MLASEVSAGRRDSATQLSVPGLTITGGFLVPLRALQGRATAAAMPIDVRNGYPCLSTSAQAEEDGVWTDAGSTDRSAGFTAGRPLAGADPDQGERRLRGEFEDGTDALRDARAQPSPQPPRGATSAKGRRTRGARSRSRRPSSSSDGSPGQPSATAV